MAFTPGKKGVNPFAKKGDANKPAASTAKPKGGAGKGAVAALAAKRGAHGHTVPPHHAGVEAKVGGSKKMKAVAMKGRSTTNSGY